MVGVEVELKAALPLADLGRISRLLARRATSSGSAFLVTRYFDTRDCRLEAAGIALRLRDTAGQPTLQSIKAGRRALGGFQHSEEVESEIAGAHPDLAAVPDAALSEHLHALVGGQRLVARFETRVRRRLFHLSLPGGTVEIAIDRGLIRAGRRREPIAEIEFELKAGSPETLFQCAEQLLRNAPARLALPNKAERGAALARGAPLAAAVAASKPREVREGIPAGERFEQLLGLFAEAVAANLHMVLTTGEPEGPHQLRVALRRLRTALRLHRPILDERLARDLAVKARDIGRLVSPLRDADVLAGGLLIPRAAPALAARLGEWREGTRAAVRAGLMEQEASGLAIRLLSLAALGGWQRQGRRHRLVLPHEEVVRPALERMWQTIEALGDRLASLPPEERHGFRKELKKLRYATELMPVRSEARPFLSALKRLLEDLGDLNDLTVLEGFSPDLGSAEANAALAALKESLPQSGTARTDQLVGRACRHWRALKAASALAGLSEPSGPPPFALLEPNQ